MMTSTDLQTTPGTEDVACAVCGAYDPVVARVRSPRDAIAQVDGAPPARSRWVICRSCGLVYQSPRPERSAVEDLYLDGTYHEQRGGVPDFYVRYSLRRSRRALAWALSHHELRRDARAVDIGCGVGGALVNLRSRGLDVFGVEPDPELSNVARERFGLNVATSLLEESTLAERGEFDFAFSCHVWEHLVDPVATTTYLARSLANRSGVVCIVVPTYRRPRTWVWSNFSSAHTYLFDHRSLSNVLRLAGCEPIAFTYAAAEDSEVWILARSGARPIGPEEIDRQDYREVQRALVLAPLAAPLGAPARARTHMRTLLDDPGDFADRLHRWARLRSDRALASVRR